MEEDDFELDEVEALSDTVDGLLCRVGDERLLIPLRFVARGGQVRKPGDRGKIVLPHWLAQHLGLRPFGT